MRKIFKKFLQGLFFTVILFVSFIATTVHASLNVQAQVDVPASCTVTDTDGVAHTYPPTGSTSSYLGICALETAKENGSISDAQLSNQYPSLGLFVTSIGGVAADPNSQYWAIYQNGNFAISGLTLLSVAAGDTIMFQLHDFFDNNLGDQVTLNINSLSPPTAPAPSGGGALIINSGSSGHVANTLTPTAFNVQSALSYLKSMQAADGSFDESLLYTDWAGIAFGAANVNDNSKSSLLAYLSSHNLISSIVTDNERQAMALLALGQNPYSFNGVNYINAITNSFDGTQFGDTTLVNDDIFAIIPLSSAGYTSSDNIITKDIAFIISKQESDGSWDESADLTAAGIQALKSFATVNGVSNSISNATNYLTGAQGADGGWGSIYSTSWAMQAMSALNASWSKNSNTPNGYLARAQTADGAALTTSETLANRIWATSYAIPAALGKSWNAIMQSVPKPTNITNQIPVSPEPPMPPEPTAMPQVNSQPVPIPIANSISITDNNPQAPIKVKPVAKSKSTIAINKKPADITPNTPNTLSATAVNSLSDKTTSKTILGTIGGAITKGFSSSVNFLHNILRFFNL